MADNNTPLTIYLSLTSSPSSPRTSLTLDTNNNNGTITASELRLKASKATLVPLTSLKLIFRGRVIGDKSEGDVVKEFKLEDGCVVHVMGKPVASNAATASASATTSTTSASASAAAGASVTVPAAASNTSSTSSSPLLAALLKLRTSNDVGVYRTALTTADKLLGNIVSQPMEEKYRTIKKSNPAFTKRLGGLPGGQDLMTAAGFVVENREGVEYYVLTPSADAWPRLVAAREEVQKVVSLADNNSRSTMPPPVGTAAAGAGAAGSTLPGGMPNLFPGGMPGAGGMGAGGGGMPDMSMMQSMMSDPNMLQNVMGMMNNPTVQNMMRNDPRFANNPMLQQSLQALQSNPEMMNQMASMMGDPNVRDRMANMMQQQQQQSGTGGAGADPFAGGPEAMRRQMEQFQQMAAQHGGTSGGINAGGGGNSGTSAAGASGSNANNGSGGGNDSDMTEEEMIAEAIARSLRES